MTNLPFHDGRSFALFLRNSAKERGLNLTDMFEKGIIERSLFYRYHANQRDPKISTIFDILERLSCSPLDVHRVTN